MTSAGARWCVLLGKRIRRIPKPSDAAMQPRCGDMKDRLIPVVPQYNPAYKAGRGQAAT